MRSWTIHTWRSSLTQPWFNVIILTSRRRCKFAFLVSTLYSTLSLQHRWHVLIEAKFPRRCKCDIVVSMLRRRRFEYNIVYCKLNLLSSAEAKLDQRCSVDVVVPMSPIWYQSGANFMYLLYDVRNLPQRCHNFVCCYVKI